MLQKSRRLSSAEVARVLKTGKGASFGLVRTKYLPRPSAARVSRFAVVVSKKVLKKAVDRNKLRRRVYSLLQDKERAANVDSIIFVSSGTLTKEELKRSLEGVLSSMHAKLP